MARKLWGIWDKTHSTWCVEGHKVGSYEDDEYVESVAKSVLIYKDKGEALRVSETLNELYHDYYEVRHYND